MTLKIKSVRRAKRKVIEINTVHYPLNRNFLNCEPSNYDYCERHSKKSMRLVREGKAILDA